MAEATLTAETEVTPPNDDALTTPDPAPESVEPTDDQKEDTSHIDAFLEGLGTDDAGTAAGDGKVAPTDGVVPPPEKALTPEEIREETRKELEAEQAKNQTAAQLKAYRDGVNRSFQNVESELSAKAKEWGLDIDAADWLRQRFQNHNGHWKVLYEAAIEQAQPQIHGKAYQDAEAQVSKHLLDAVLEDLGEPAHKAITGDIGKGIKTWPDMAKAIAKEARKGYVPQSNVTEAQRKALEKVDVALKERGLSLAQFTGNSNPQTPAIKTSGNYSTPEALDKAFGNKEIDSATYKARYKALTGREP